MNASNIDIGTDQPDHGQGFGDAVSKVQSKGFLAVAARLFELFALFGMVVWLALKDWFISGTVPYPYGQSIGASLSVIVSVLAAFTISRASSWRNILLGLFAGCCLIYLLCSSKSADCWNLMPTAGILVCALAFPWPADPRWLSFRKQMAQPQSLVRRRCYMAASFMGLAAFISSHDSDLFMAFLTMSAVVAAGFLLRFLIRSITSFRYARHAIIVVYTTCILSYWGMTLYSFFTDPTWNLLGHGLGSGGQGNFHFCSDSLFEGGLISAFMRGLILTEVLSTSASSVLNSSRIRAEAVSKAVRDELSETMELSTAALLSVFALVFILPIFAPSVWPDPTSIASWALGLSLATLWIAARSLESLKREIVPEAYNHRRLVGVFAGMGAGAILMLLSIVPSIVLALSLGQVPSNVAASKPTALDVIPASLMRATIQNTPAVPPLASAHDLVRQACGAPVTAAPSLYMTLALQTTAHDDSPRLAQTLKASLLAIAAYRCIEPFKAVEVYLNGLDYGAPKPGLSAAAKYYFNKPVSSLSPAEAKFLVAGHSGYSSEPLIGWKALEAPTDQRLQSVAYYSYHQIPFPTSGTTYVNHDGTVNNSGEAVGTSFTDKGPRAYAWNKGSFRILKSLNGRVDNSWALVNNDQGRVVGWSTDSIGNQHAVEWDARGRITDLGALPDYPNSVARCINNNGQIVGYAFTQSSGTFSGSQIDGPAHAFLWQSGKMTDLGTMPGCPVSRAYSINDSGQIAGWVITDSGSTHAIVWQNGIMHDIGTLGGANSIATSINKYGQVVGAAQHSDGTVTSFLWENGVMHDIGKLPGDARSRAWCINDLGQVVGYSFGSDLNGPGGHPYIWDIRHGIRSIAPLMRGDSATTRHLSDTYTVYSINNKGQILGLSFLPKTRAMFMLQPMVRSPGD